MKRKSAVLALAVVILSVTAVQAVPITYVYTGNPFTGVEGPYTTSDFVRARVRLDSPLAANTSLTQVTPLAFSLSDGVQTITNLNAFSSFFYFETGPTGMITQWQVHAQIAFGFAPYITTRNIPGEVFDTAAVFDPGGGGGGIGTSNFNPGVWATAAVPDVGSTLALLSLSLTALGALRRL